MICSVDLRGFRGFVKGSRYRLLSLPSVSRGDLSTISLVSVGGVGVQGNCRISRARTSPDESAVAIDRPRRFCGMLRRTRDTIGTFRPLSVDR